MYHYKLVIHSLGVNASAKAIDAKKMKFWSEKSPRELTEYLFSGDDEFEDFKVPKYAKFSGTYAEDEPILGVEFSDEPVEGMELSDGIYGPLREKISHIELSRFHNSQETKIAPPDGFEIPNLQTSEGDEDISVGFGVAEHSLVIIVLESGEWHYEWESKNPDLGFDDIFCIASNNAFGEDIDSMIDDVICAIVVEGEQVEMGDDTETESKGMIAMLASD